MGDEPASALELACVEAWNRLAERVPNLRPAWGAVDRHRLRKLRDALVLLGGPEGWAMALERVEESPLWRGDAGDRGWRPTLGDALEPAKLTGLMEGAYAAWDRPMRCGASEVLRQFERHGIELPELPP